MATPTVYKKLAARLPREQMRLWKPVIAGIGLCLVSITWAFTPLKPGLIDPFLRLAAIVTGASIGALLALSSFTLICVRYWFGNPTEHPDSKKNMSLWPRLGDYAFGYSDWYACVALFCLFAACVWLAVGMVTHGLVPIVTLIV